MLKMSYTNNILEIEYTHLFACYYMYIEETFHIISKAQYIISKS